MLIEWILLNEFKTPIKKGDFKCKTTHKLRRKQFNVLNNKYWKFLIHPSFATTNFAEVCLDIVFAKINSMILRRWSSFYKTKLLQQLIPSNLQKLFCQKIENFTVPAPLPTPGWLVRQNACFVSLTL